MNKKIKPKLIVILGPTASGKTGLAVKLAREINGEIVSADSRQVYVGMDVGTGKDLKEYEIGKIPYHLIDVVDPKKEFNIARYKEMAEKAIQEIVNRNKIPILVGGSGLYLQAVVDNYQLSKFKDDKNSRKELEKFSVEELFLKIKKINSKFANKLNISDRKNKRRLIRYIEIQKQGIKTFKKGSNKYDVLMIGLTEQKEIINQKIYKRLIDRLEKEDMVEEIKNLHKQGVSWRRLESFGLEYKFISQYLQDKFPYDEMVEKLFIAIRQFAKRQMTWFRRWERQGRQIQWFPAKEDYKNVLKLAKNFIK